MRILDQTIWSRQFLAKRQRDEVQVSTKVSFRADLLPHSSVHTNQCTDCRINVLAEPKSALHISEATLAVIHDYAQAYSYIQA